MAAVRIVPEHRVGESDQNQAAPGEPLGASVRAAHVQDRTNEENDAD
jgi:hypothetical protein